ncbi:MAG TPA: hypothetical protein VGX96_19790 [Candidatus Elarobacter sp.]|jgi:hypothetical protein|nr:hypothetical protein [Candidatus Elarobacter sp.]
MLIRRLFAVALLALAASCGHKDAQTTTTTTTAQTPSAAAPVKAVPTGAAGGAMSGGVGNGSASGTMNGAAHPARNGNPPGFDTESAAQTHCPSDQVVWLNTRSHIYHEKGTRYYGTTKQGEYACRKEADAAGDRNSKA